MRGCELGSWNRTLRGLGGFGARAGRLLEPTIGSLGVFERPGFDLAFVYQC